MKKLILGKAYPALKPDDCLCAGPWVFAGQEKLFPDWEKNFVFAPEPLADSQLLIYAAKTAQSISLEYLPAMAKFLHPQYFELSETYWETLLLPFMLDAARQITDRALRCRIMIETWKDLELSVTLLPENIEFNFKNEQDFLRRGALGHIFNHWLFSRLLESDWPENWQKVYEDTKEQNYSETGINLKNSFSIKDICRKISLMLLFPKLKGMKITQALRFSVSLLHICQKHDHSLDLRQNFLNPLLKIPLPADIFAIFKKCLPCSIKKLKHNKRIKKTDKPRFRIANIIAYEDSKYRQKLAYWRAGGNRLGYVQHGGNYGQVRTACDVEVVEYSQDAFFTWGWKKHGDCKGNFIPMPSLLLNAEANSWNENSAGKMIFVGAEMSAYGRRLDSSPTPLQFLEYRRAKALFFKALNMDIRKNTLYRPYFPLPGTFEDADWLLPQFSELEICKGALLPWLLNCRILVIDHPGTTMLEALAANIPVVLYWNRKHWPETYACEKLLDILQKAEIWFDNPQDAAKKVSLVWNCAIEWKNSNAYQNARKIYCKNQANAGNASINKIWTSTLEKI